MPERVWEEFLPLFWEEPVSGLSTTNGIEQTVQMKEFVSDLFNDAVESYLSRDQQTYQSWQEKKQVLLEAREQGIHLTDFLMKNVFTMDWCRRNNCSIYARVAAKRAA